MTNKALLGLVGGGSVAAGLGTGFGVGFNTQPFYINEDMMNTFYSSLISDAEFEITEYKKMEKSVQEDFLKKYKDDVCKIAQDNKIEYKVESAKKRAEADKALCDATTTFDKAKWEPHFLNSAQDLREEWSELMKNIYKKPTKNPNKK